MHQFAFKNIFLRRSVVLKQGVTQSLKTNNHQLGSYKSTVAFKSLSSCFNKLPKYHPSHQLCIGNNFSYAPISRSLHIQNVLHSDKDDKTPPPVTDTEPKKADDSVQKVSILDSMFKQEPSEDKYKDKKWEEGQTEKEKTEEKPAEETPFQRSQRYGKWMLIVGLCVNVPMFILLKGRPMQTEEGDIIEDQYSKHIAPIAYVKRSWGELMDVKREFVEPSSKKLLPDPVKEPYYQPPYTLVMELMDVFLHPVYDSVTGWRFKKRPGIEYFFSQVGPPMYEIVIFTKELGMTAFPLIESMDPKGYIMYRLFRDSARYKVGFNKGDIMNGEMPKLDPYYQKDLRYLNRDLSKVIMIDCDKRAFEANPDNGLCINKWDGSSNDSTLYDLASFLRTIAVSQVSDVRDVVKHYSKKDDVIGAFKEAQRKMEDDEKFMEKYQKENPPQLSFLSGKGLSSWFK